MPGEIGKLPEMAAPGFPRPNAKVAPKVALVQLDSSTVDTLARTFAQCGIQTVPVGEDFRERFAKEQFQGCVVGLNDDASAVLDSVRSSRSNSKAILYGIVSRDYDVRRLSSYGINAILDAPLDRNTVLKVARSTCALLLHELRRYVRIPIVVEVSIDCAGVKLLGSSREVSGGGMSVALNENARLDNGKVCLLFSLPNTPPVSIAASMCWQNGSQTGFQFQDSDVGRQIVKDWINSFLGLQ